MLGFSLIELLNVLSQMFIEMAGSLMSIPRALCSERFWTNEEPTFERYGAVKPAGFSQSENQKRGGASERGSVINGQHRHVFVTLTAPKNCSFMALADDQKTFCLDGDFGSLLHLSV